MGRKTNIFAIYTLENKDVMLHLLRHLKPFEKDFNVSIWHDDPIQPMRPWKPQNEAHLDHADIFLLLVSDDFMHSQFIKQIEFKDIIDRYKENKSIVIPVLIDYCQWDIDFKSEDYNFNFNELRVLPEEGKPIVAWDSPNQAYTNVATGLKRVIRSLAESIDQEESKKDIEEKAANAIKEDQIAIRFKEEEEANNIVEEGSGNAKKLEVKREAEEVKRSLEEAEAKRRTEEKDRLKKEAEAAADRRAEEERRRMDEAAAKRKTEQEQRLKEELEPRNRVEKENRQEPTAQASEKVEDRQQEKNTNRKKKVLTGSLIAILAVAGIWAFSVFNTGPEKQSPPLPKIKAAVSKDSIALAKTKIDSLNSTESFSKLVVGDTYDGGIVFAIDKAGKSGKMVRPTDSGTMTWKDATEVLPQLGEVWRLPTLDELRILYRTVGQGATNSAQFADELYWSATPYDEYQARLLRFRDGNTSYHYNKEAEHRKFQVRAVRDFSR